jgi:hypothetical protein
MPSPKKGIKGFFLVFMVCFTSSIFAQNSFVLKAKVVDSVNNIVISNFDLSIATHDVWTTVPYTSIQDSIFSKQFVAKFNRVKFSLVGYKSKTFKVLVEHPGLIDLGEIQLVKNEISLSEVKIKSRRRFLDLDSAVFKFSDSTFAGYKMADDVLKLIPGIKIINNNIFYNGVNITNVKVGNRNFFFNDNDLLLNNLPGYAIDKIEIIQPSADQKNYQNEKSSLNIVLKNGSQTGYLTKSLVSYGTNKRKVLDLFIGRMDSTYQIGVTSNNNNVNDKNPVVLAGVSPMSGASNSTEHKIVFSKDFRKFSFQLNYEKLNSNFENHQEISRIETIDDGLLKTSYINNSKNKNNTDHLLNSAFYRFKPNIVLAFSQDILKNKINFINTTSIVLDSTQNSQIIANDNNGTRIENTLRYNSKDIEDGNKMLELQLSHLDNNFNYLNSYNSLNEVNRNLISRQFVTKGMFTYIFQKNNYLIASFDNNFNKLFHSVDLNDYESYSQIHSSLKVKFGANLKKWDYLLSVENFYYDFQSSKDLFKKRYNKILPLLNLSYNLGNGYKLGGMLSNSVSIITLDQLSSLLSNNEILSRNVNFSVSPEKVGTMEFHFEKLSNNKNVYLNFGLINRQNVAENILTGSLRNGILLTNVGNRKSLYLTARQDYKLSQRVTFASYFHMVQSKLNSNAQAKLSNSKTDLQEVSLSLQYNYSKIDLMLACGFITNKRHFNDLEGDYKDISYNTAVILNYLVSSNMKFALNFNGQYYENDFSYQSAKVVGMVNLVSQYVFLKNKNLTSFFKVNNLLNNATINFQDFQSGSYVQTSRISTLGRYFLVGCSYRFNTLKR